MFRAADQEAIMDQGRHGAASLSERTVATGRAVLAGERRGLRASLAFAGPAVVASIAYMDPGNFATNIQAGAKYGYGLLWVVLLDEYERWTGDTKLVRDLERAARAALNWIDEYADLQQLRSTQ